MIDFGAAGANCGKLSHMEPTSTPGAKSCPDCGGALQPYGAPRSLSAARILATDLLLWVTAVFFFAYLWSPRHEGELYAILAALTLVVWTLMRTRQRADRAHFATHGRYHCAQCGRHFEGDELRQL